MPDLSLPLPCNRLLPHRDPMLLAGDLVEVRPGFARVGAAIGPDNPFLDARGALDPLATVELTAQTIAALRGYEAVSRGEPVHIGYLVGIKDFAIEAPVRAGDALEAEVRQEFAMDQAALMTAEVRRGAQRIAAGTLKIWEEREWPSAPPPAKFGVRASARAFLSLCLGFFVSSKQK
jgi:predicted hotdog family 3-hydroxylacyl-ACP dehydratase